MILIVDNYDSFTWNLVQAIEMLGEKTLVISNDEIHSKLVKGANPSKMIISPGPGAPKDAGNSSQIIKDWWKKTPILGVCLGHQCIGSVFGSSITSAKKIMHGKTSLVYHNQSGLFENTPSPFQAARYHSLSVNTVPKEFEKSAWTNDGEIMSIAHQEKPVFGVQFHPESFLTPVGSKILENFLNV